MAQDPTINLNVDTTNAVRNLMGLETQALETDGSIDKIDGSSVSVDTTATQRALQDVAEKLERVDDKAQKAGKDGIPVTTTAFKDLTEGIGGPAGGAIGSAFAFGETIEGLGDILEGYGGKLGLTEGQIGKMTSALGNGLAILGGLGVALTVGMAAYEKFGQGAKKAREEQKKTNAEIDTAADSLRDVAEALREGERATAVRKVLEDITPLLDDMGKYGLNAADAVREIMGEGRPFTDALYKMATEMKGFDAESNQAREDLLLLLTEIGNKRDGVERAAEQDGIATEVLGDLNTAVQDNTEYLKENTKKLEERRLKQLEAITTERDLELQLLDTKDAIEEYDQKIADAKGDTDEMRRITLETAGEITNMATEFGKLSGPEGSIENVKATREALTFLSSDLAPGSPLRANILGTVADLARIETGFVSGGPITGAALAAKEGGVNAGYRSNTTINVTVTSADPQAVVRALQTYVRQNGSLPANLR